MSMNLHIRTKGLALILLLLSASAACTNEPDTRVDLDTPVNELPGWPELMADLDLSDGREATLIRWVEVFREGLDIARGAPTEAERQELEAAWWEDGELTVEALVGPDDAHFVMEWLEARFGRSGEA